MEVVFDIETDSLNPSCIHLVVAKEVGAKQYYVIRSKKAFHKFAEGVTHWIAHNGIGFDIPVIADLWDYEIPLSMTTDTLVLSRLFEPTRKGGHSLKEWGKRLGEYKGDFTDFTEYSEEMKQYCKQDVKVTELVYKQLLKEGEAYSDTSIKLEHTVHKIMCEQQANGFLLDQEVAQEIYTTCLRETTQIEADIKEFMKPLVIPVKEVNLRYTKAGTLHTHDKLEDTEVIGDYSKIKFEEFNLASPTQVNKRLDLLGWKPYVKTATGKSYKICPENLATIPEDAPEAVRRLKTWKVLETRWKIAKEWLELSQVDGRVHGQVILTGAKTHRAAHRNPNMANIPSVPHGSSGDVLWGMDGLYAAECRKAFTVPEGSKLVGTDASSIQLRILCHYMNDPVYTNQVVAGDIHTFNQEALGVHCKDRSTAKTFIYAFLLGAGNAKIAEILNCTMNQARDAMESFYGAIPSLRELKSKASVAASMGWMKGLDGRVLPIGSEHLALSVYLQGGETVIMRLANVLWYKQAKKEGLSFKQCAWVHDEWQTEVDKHQAERLGELQVNSIRKAGEILNLNCPLDGESKIGNNWLETH